MTLTITIKSPYIYIYSSQGINTRLYLLSLRTWRFTWYFANQDAKVIPFHTKGSNQKISPAWFQLYINHANEDHGTSRSEVSIVYAFKIESYTILLFVYVLGFWKIRNDYVVWLWRDATKKIMLLHESTMLLAIPASMLLRHLRRELTCWFLSKTYQQKPALIIP